MRLLIQTNLPLNRSALATMKRRKTAASWHANMPIILHVLIIGSKSEGTAVPRES